MQLLTNSRAGAFRACSRLHHYRYELGMRPVEEAESLRFGTLIHKALEAWWKAADGERMGDAWAALLAGEAEPFDRAKAEAMVRGYDARWGNADEYEVLAIEAEFSMLLVNPATGRASPLWRVGGKLDGVIRERSTGDVLVLEHKTATGDIGPGSDYVKRLKMDSQVSLYFDGASAMGFEPARCLYDILGKPALRPLKVGKQRDRDETPNEYRDRCIAAIGEDPNKYFQRSDVVRLEAELDEARFDLWQVAAQIRESELAKRAPRNAQSCMRYGRNCEYLGVCCSEISLEDPRHFKKSDTLHPELSGSSKEEPNDSTS